MLKFFKRKKGKKSKSILTPQTGISASDTEGKLKRHISLPLIDTGTQADLSPRTLGPNRSLLDYHNSTHSIPDHLSYEEGEGEEEVPGYSTVRDAIGHYRRDGKARGRGTNWREKEGERGGTKERGGREELTVTAEIRPLPPVPVEVKGHGSCSGDSTFTSLTPEEGVSLSDNEDPPPIPIYATVNKNRGRDGGCGEVGVAATPTMGPSSDPFELSESEGSLLNESGEEGMPRPSSPLSVTYPAHLPPRSPNPGRKATPTNTSSKQKSKNSKQTKPLSHNNNPRVKVSPVNLSDIPVYNLNQSPAEGYILSRTHPDGTVEHFTATPFFKPASPSPFSHQSAPFTNDMSSTPVDYQSPAAQSPMGFQFPTAIPHTPIPHTSNDQNPIPHNSIPHIPIPHTSTPVKPPQSNASVQFRIQPQSSIPVQSHGLIPIPVRDPVPRPILNKRLSYSQPSSLNVKSYVGGISEIDQLIADGEYQLNGTGRKRLSLPINGECLLPAGQQQQAEGGESHDIKGRQAQAHDVTAEQLVNDTPLKFKRLLDKLLTQRMEKDKEIKSLKNDIVGLEKTMQEMSFHNTSLNESHVEEMKLATAEKQQLNETLSAMKRENEQLRSQLDCSSQQLESTRKEHVCKVDRLKGELKSMREEISSFQSSVHAVGHQYRHLRGAVSAYDSHTHVPLEEHRRTVAKLERLLQQVVSNGSSSTFNKHLELSSVKRDNQLLTLELADLRGSYAAVSNECGRLREKNREYSDTVSLLNKDLREREVRWASPCNGGHHRTLTEMTKLDRERRELSPRQPDLRWNGARELVTTSKHDHDNAKRGKQSSRQKTRVKISELETELMKKEQLLEEMSLNKRLAERQRDLLWQTRTN